MINIAELVKQDSNLCGYISSTSDPVLAMDRIDPEIAAFMLQDNKNGLSSELGKTGRTYRTMKMHERVALLQTVANIYVADSQERQHYASLDTQKSISEDNNAVVRYGIDADKSKHESSLEVQKSISKDHLATTRTLAEIQKEMHTLGIKLEHEKVASDERNYKRGVDAAVTMHGKEVEADVHKHELTTKTVIHENTEITTRTKILADAAYKTRKIELEELGKAILTQESGSITRTELQESGSTERAKIVEQGLTIRTELQESGSAERTKIGEQSLTTRTELQESGSTKRTMIEEQGLTGRTKIVESNLTDRLKIAEQGRKDRELIHQQIMERNNSVTTYAIDTKKEIENYKIATLQRVKEIEADVDGLSIELKRDIINSNENMHLEDLRAYSESDQRFINLLECMIEEEQYISKIKIIADIEEGDKKRESEETITAYKVLAEVSGKLNDNNTKKIILTNGKNEYVLRTEK